MTLRILEDLAEQAKEEEGKMSAEQMSALTLWVSSIHQLSHIPPDLVLDLMRFVSECDPVFHGDFTREQFKNWILYAGRFVTTEMEARATAFAEWLTLRQKRQALRILPRQTLETRTPALREMKLIDLSDIYSVTLPNEAVVLIRVKNTQPPPIGETYKTVIYSFETKYDPHGCVFTFDQYSANVDTLFFNMFEALLEEFQKYRGF